MHTIGRIDKADFTEFDLQNISIKVDTGAFTSSIHSHDIKEVEANGEKYIEFKLLDPSHPKYKDKILKAKNYEVRTIKNSFGTSENRFIIQTKILIFGQEYPIELSLSERSDMKFPVLLGRRFLNRKFIVNTSLKNLSFKLKQEQKKAK
jgi:hypothetical protein